MTIKPLRAEDWDIFVDWAEAEGWRISLQELRLFQSQWRPWFYVLWHNGERCAFLSAVVYKSSAWIGNLIVRSRLRRRGYGAAIFIYALDLLRSVARVKRIWLTASDQGAPLYQQHGFVDIDRIERWCGSGRNEHALQRNFDLDALIACDSLCWGESRAALLSTVDVDAHLIADGGGMALLQPGIDFWVIGPWLNHGGDAAGRRQIITRAVESVPRGKQVMTDVLSSSGSAMLLQQSGFKYLGSNRLMCCAEEQVELKGVLALASLGSIG